MKFSELRNATQEDTGKQLMSDYFRNYLQEDRLKKIDEIRDRYVHHLFEDLSSMEVPFDFKAYLKTAFDDSNNHAGDCIRRSLYARELLPRDIKYWTEGALKCFDHFLLIFIQDVCFESVPSFTNLPKETDVYEYLISKGGEAQDIGEAFKYIYQFRNSFYHVQHVTNGGRREIIKMSNKQYRRKKEIILTYFTKALSKFKLFEEPIASA